VLRSTEQSSSKTRSDEREIAMRMKGGDQKRRVFKPSCNTQQTTSTITEDRQEARERKIR